ncbi:uncharacterized protein LOC129717253 [Wyeomyia smithii]|uniref:uncharacterized protein LOC129717253 n=1 Tax=Wyeomyia smithii TaxID=174621 RepID=UPI002467EC5E|nr:uncharacterized protein LOC129717253 [Wyeomyia smithii]
MAQYVAAILGKLVGKTEFHVRNSFDFAEEFSRVQVPDGYVMYSLDVVSLYTNVPVEEVYECVEERWGELQEHTTIPWNSFKEAMKTVLDASFFQYEGKFYGQKAGGPMGSPLSPVVANIIMEKLENEAIARLKQQNISLRTYRRYVDDCFVVGKKEEIKKVVKEFNERHEKINFAIENEIEAKIWFPKQQYGRYLDYNSESPHTHKVNTAIALVDRALKLTDVESRIESIKTARKILRNNNYPEALIQRTLERRVHLLYNTLQGNQKTEQPKKYVSLPYVPGLSEKVGKMLKNFDITASFKPSDKVKNVVFTKLKDAVPKMKQINVVYSIPCGACDDKHYIGQTSQTLEKRIGQHKNSIRTNTSATGLTQHTLEHGHSFDFSRTRILERINNNASRLSAELLHIKMNSKTTVNLQREVDGFSNTYNNLAYKLKNEQQPTQRRRKRNERKGVT